MNTLSFFGIYPDEVERVNEICQDILNHAHATDREVNDLYDMIYNMFYNEIDYTSYGSVTNALIDCMFDTLNWWLNKKYKGLDTSFYVNGWDSNFTINGENGDDYEFE